MSREAILSSVRAALSRKSGQAVPPPPEWAVTAGDMPVAARIELFTARLEALNGKVRRAPSPQDAGAVVAEILGGKSAIASPAPYLETCGVRGMGGVIWGAADPEQWREACATVDFGVTSASYALADTGSLVTIAGPSETRLASLLPPVHVAVIPAEAILTGLDELFLKVPKPAEIASSMVLITGPSRTADIEQILVRGVHGPGEIYVVIVGE
ncbi:MAG TPA: lactate utilization protein [Bryobacteraceae bacterium]|nr:lactate utilization protein [Bryobacteraceae bacterium]